MGTQESHIKELLVWIEDNLTNPLSLDIVSAKSGYTKWYLQRMFKKQTGLSLASYIRARRLYLAAFALRFTQKSILDISVEYQFDNQQTFSRCFKKHFAESPSVYRHARKQDFSNLVRSLAASQPGDIQVERVSIARGNTPFTASGTLITWISRSWTSRTCRSAARCGAVLHLVGRAPDANLFVYPAGAGRRAGQGRLYPGRDDGIPAARRRGAGAAAGDPRRVLPFSLFRQAGGAQRPHHSDLHAGVARNGAGPR